MRSRRGLALITCAVMLVLPASAAAHAYLATASPASGVVLSSSPRSLRLVFDEEVAGPYARVSVVGQRGANLAGAPRVAGAVVTVPLRLGRAGSYTVRWRMVATDDGHATQGAYSFGVRVKPLPPAPARGVSIPVAPQLFAWLQFVGVVLAGGMLAFRALVWGPSARELAGGEAPDARIVIGAGVIGATLALHAGVLAFLAGVYPIVGGGLSNLIDTQIEPLRVGTHLGQAWTVTTFAWFAVLGLLIAAWVTPRKREQLLAGAGVAALLTSFGLSWASHPASRGTVALVTDYVHLLAAALWVGGLVGLVLLAMAMRRLSAGERERVIRVCLVRLSRLVVPTVAVLALAGAYLALRELPAPSALFTSSYGVTLLIKSAIAAGALALGAYHQRLIVPRIEAGAPVATIRRTVAVELGLLLTALVLAAMLSQTAPPR